MQYQTIPIPKFVEKYCLSIYGRQPQYAYHVIQVNKIYNSTNSLIF